MRRAIPLKRNGPRVSLQDSHSFFLFWCVYSNICKSSFVSLALLRKLHRQRMHAPMRDSSEGHCSTKRKREESEDETGSEYESQGEDATAYKQEEYESEEYESESESEYESESDSENKVAVSKGKHILYCHSFIKCQPSLIQINIHSLLASSKLRPRSKTAAPSKSRPRSKTAAPSESRQSLGAPRPKRGSAENIANIRQSNIETAERQIEAGTHSLTATHLAQQQFIGGHRPSKLRRLAMDGQEAAFRFTLGDANAPNGCSEKVRILDAQDFAESQYNLEDEQVIFTRKGEKKPELATNFARNQMIKAFRKQGCKVAPGYTSTGRNSYGGSNGITHADVYHICLHSRPSGLEDVKKITTKGCTKKNSGRSCGCANHHHGC